MGSGRARKFAAAAVAALLLASLCAVIVATAAPKAAGVSQAARPAGARQMSYSCAYDLYNARKVLHFATRPSSCGGSGRKLITFSKDAPVYTCRKEHGGFAARQKRFQFPSGIYGHGPAGLMRWVSSLSQCAPPSQPNETPVTLPSTKVWRLFCAAKQGGELRWVNNNRSCNSREFLVGLPPDTSSPVAKPDTGATDEDHGTNVNVLANDRNTAASNSNAGLQVQPLDTTGTRGSVSVNPDGTIAYSPNGQFESLKVGQSATASFKYRVKRGAHTSAPATVTITVGGVNDLPVATGDSATTDSAHTKSIPVLANDTDADGDSLSPTVDTAGTQGSVTVNGDGTVTYDPNHKFDSLAPNATAHDTFKYKANDGHGDSNVATVDVTIGGTDDPPVVTTSSGATPYTEGAGFTAVDAGVTVTDADSPQLTSGRVAIVDGQNINDILELPAPAPGGITGFYDSATGVLSLSGNTSAANWQAALRTVRFRSNSDNPFPTKKLEFKVGDGNSDSAPSTKTISVTGVNDAPSVTTTGGTADYTEDSPAVAVDPSIDVSDPDSEQFQGATVSITGNFSSADGDTLNFTDQNGITHSYNSATGVLALTGAAAISDYQAAIQSITFSNTSNNPSTATRTVSFKVNDGAQDSNTATRGVTVAGHNDAPKGTDQALSTNEDNGLPITLAGTDPEGDSLTFTYDQPAHGVNSGLGGSPTYQPSADYCGPDSFTFHVDDGNGGTGTGTVSINVICANDAPTVATTAGQASFVEDGSAAQVDPGITVGDVDSANLASATVSITTNFSSTDGDTLNFTDQNGITHGYNSSTGVLTLTGPSSVANFQTALRSITFSNSSNTPSTAIRTVSFKVTDPDSADSNTATRDVTVAPHNDAPKADNQSTSTNEDNAVGITLTGSDPEGSAIMFAADQPSHGSVSPTNASSVTYTPAQDYCGPDSFTFHTNDGTDNSANGTVTITVTCVNDAPVVDLNGAGAGSDETRSFTEGGGAVVIAPTPTLTDVDNANLTEMTVTLMSRPDGDSVESLLPPDTSGTSIVVDAYNSSTGVLFLHGSDTKANYVAALQGIAYNNTSQNPNTSDRIIKVKVKDAANAESNEQQTTMSVARSNDPPTADDQSGLTTNEDTALPITLTGNDIDGDSISFHSDQPTAGSGSVSPTTGSSVTYTPAANFCGDTSFTFHTNDGTVNSGNATVSIHVNCVNDAPVVDLNGGDAGTGSTATFEESNLTPAQLAPSGTISDSDSTELKSLTVTLTNPQDGLSESLAASAAGTGLTVDAYDPGTGILLIHPTTGTTAPLTDYQSVLQTVTYSDSAHPPTSTPNRDITFVARDASDADSAASHATVTVLPIDAPPVTDLNGTANAGFDTTATFTEGTAATLAPNTDLTDVDDTNLESATITITNLQDGGAESLAATTAGTSITADAYVPATGVLFLHGTDTVANYQQVLRTIAYNNTSQNPNTTHRSISFKTNDGQVDSNLASVDLTVTPVNDAPTLDLNAGSAGVNTTADFTEDQASPTTLAPNTVADDVDNANLTSATITLTNPLDATAETLIADTTGTSVIASYDTDHHVVTLSGNRPLGEYQQVLQNIKYNNTSQNADTTNRVVTFVVNDGTDNSNSPTATVTIHVVNDPPVVDLNGTGGSGINSSAAFTEDSPGSPGNGPLSFAGSATVTDVDNANIASATITLTNPQDGALESITATLPGGSPISLNGGYNSTTGVLSLTGPATKAQYEAAIQSLKYNNTSNTPGTTARVVNVKINDGTADSSPVAQSTITVTPTNDPPQPDNEAFISPNQAVGNTTFVGNGPEDATTPSTPDPTDTSPGTSRPHKTITADILAGDTDPEGNSFTVTNAGTAASGGTNGATEDGGTVTVTSGGDFVVEPKKSTSCTDHQDSFTYKVTDNGSPAGSATATVTFDIAGCVWYVNNNDAQGSDGTSEKPFDSLSDAQTAATTAADTIFVYKGTSPPTPYTGGFDLQAANQKLVGEAATLTVGSDTLQAGGGDTRRPVITDASSNVVNLAANSTVTGLQLDPQGGGGISGSGAGDAAGTIDDVKVIDTGTPGTAGGLDLNTTSGTYNVSNLTVDTSGATSPTSSDIGVKLNANTGTVNFASSGTISLKTAGAKALDAVSTNMGSGSVFDDITVTGSGSGGVNLNGTTGTTQLGDGSLTDLSLTTTSGAPAALTVANAGTVSVPTGGTANLSATGGPAADITGTSGATFDLDTVSSSGSSTDGVNISGLGAGSFTATGGSIGGQSGIGFDLDGGNGTITYPGTFNDTAGGTTADITNRTAGVNSNVTFSGNVNDTTAGAGGGISSSGNSAGTVTFSGGTKKLDTGASDAVNLSFPNASTASFVLSGGGLDIDTTSGKGLQATGVDGNDGNVQVSTGANANTIDTGSGKSLNITNSNPNATGVTFQHISGNGANAGILLNNTGSNNALTVASDGTGACKTSPSAANCTGGEIKNTTGADDSGTTPAGTAVVMNNTKGVSLTRMLIHDNSNYAIRGNNVSGGFAFDQSVINGTSGTAAPASASSPFNESAIRFTELTGSSNAITNSAISGGVSDNVKVVNTAGTLNRLTLQSDTIGTNSTSFGNDAVGLSTTGSAVANITVDSSTFTAAAGDIFGVSATGTSSDIVFTNNDVTNNHPAIGTGGGGISIFGGGATNTTLNFSNNSLHDSVGNAITLVHDKDPAGTGTYTGTVDNNDIGCVGTDTSVACAPGPANSGATEGRGIFLRVPGTTGATSLAITNNNVRNVNSNGIEVEAGSAGIASSTGNIDATVTGNTVANPGTNGAIVGPFQGIHLNSGTTPGQAFTICMNVKANTINGSGKDGGTDFRLRQRQSSTVRLPGYGGSATNNATVTSFIQNQNDGNPNSAGAEPTVPTGAVVIDSSGFAGGAACTSG